MNQVIFIDKDGIKQSINVSDFCTVTLNIQNGNVVKTSYNQSLKMEKTTPKDN